MSNRSDRDFLSDIREAILRITSYVGGMSSDTFMDDIKTQDAVVRNLEIIGEATKNLSEQLCIENPEIPWRSMAGVRDRLIHHYFGVNLDIVWQIVTAELPLVAMLLDKIIEEDIGEGDD